jgi:ribonuclease P protein component
MGEANLSAQEAQAHAHAWLPRSDADSGWASRDQGPPSERSGQAHRLTWRIRDRATFDALTRRKRIRRGPVSLTVVSVDGSSPPRVAYAVGRRVGGAVTRNRVRRRLRAAVTSHRSQLEPGRAYLLGASPAAAGMSFAELEAAVGQLLATAADR